MQYLKICPESMKMCLHTSIFDTNQLASQTKGSIHSSVKFLEMSECIANIYFYTQVHILHKMPNLHTGE